MIGASVMAVAAVVAPAPVPVPTDGIAAAMADSAAGWNAGDLDRFMRVYADDAVYVTSKGVVRGRAAIAVRYAASFAKGGNKRGRLSFTPVVERTIGAGHRLFVARWTLTGAGGTAETGLTTLLFERKAAGWRIVSDHSS